MAGGLPDVFPISIEQVVGFLFVFVRVGSIIIFMPVIGSGTIPAHVKIGLIFTIALIAYPIVNLGPVNLEMGLIELTLLLSGEVMVGVVIGYIVRLIFAAAQVAGAVTGFQIGFGIVNVIDPATNTQISVTSQLLSTFSMLIFLTINAHHFFLSAIMHSYTAVPPFGFSFNGALFQEIFRLSADMFVIAAKIAAPIMVTILIVAVSLGLIARTVPQMNVFIVGFPLNIGIGLFMFGITMPYFFAIMKRGFNDAAESVYLILSLMG